MAYARIVWWKIKSGKRDEAVKRMNGYLDEIKETKGYRGMVSLLSMNNPNRITVVTLWDSEEAMKGVESGVFQKVVSALSDIIEEKPQVANQEVGIFDMAKVLA